MNADQAAKSEDLESILKEIAEIEREYGSLGICFSKASDFLPPDQQTECEELRMTAEFATLVRDLMLKSVEIVNSEVTLLEPVYDQD